MQSQTINRLGFFYPTNTHQQTLRDLHNWLEQIKDLPASWVVVQGASDRAVPEPFIKGLLEAGLDPIVQIPCQVGAVRPETIHPLLYSYAHWGLKHVIVYDRPNLKRSWAGNTWANTNLTERFVDAILPTLQAAFSAGLIPTLPPLEPGGDYWDTAFLKSTLKVIARRGQKDLVDALVLSAYAPVGLHKLNWGKGGPIAWPEARPYCTPVTSEDHQGFNIFEWYRAIAAEALGKPRPVLTLNSTEADQKQTTAEQNTKIAQTLADPSNSTGLLAFIFNKIPFGEDRSKWLEAASSAKSKAKNKKYPQVDIPKRLAHYLLLPDQEQAAVPIWRKATAFALTHQPVIGFSTEEALLAQRVTIAADFETIPAEVDEKLQAAGCKVERLSLLPQQKSACIQPASINKNV